MTRFVTLPTPSMLARTVSPGLISDTPSGVPVMRMSPGSIVMNPETYEMSLGIVKIMS